MTVTAAGFAPSAQDVEVRSAVAASVKVSLQGDWLVHFGHGRSWSRLVENDPTGHTDVDRDLFNKWPLESQSSSLSSLSRSPRLVCRRIRMVSFTDSATTRRTHSR